MNRITDTGARIMVQTLTKSFVDATPAFEEPGAYVIRARRLQDQLGRVLGVTPTHWDVEELITSYEELESVETGTHPELVTNLARTIDNTDVVTDYLLGRIGRETTTLLNNASFGELVAA